MRIRSFAAFMAVVTALSFPIPVSAEALPSLAMMNLFYRMGKNRVTDEDLKIELAAIDGRLRDGYTSGRMSEVRRELAHGMALAFGRGWSDKQDFESSLALRTERAFIDPRMPIMVRLEQIYPSVLVKPGKMTATIALHEPARRRMGSPQPGAKLQDLANLPEVGLDLIETPLIKQVDLAGIADGDYDVRIEVFDGDDLLGAASTRLRIRAGLDDRLAALRANAAAAPKDVQSSILFPLDFMRKIDTGLVEARGFDVDAELAAAETIVATVAEGKDPFKGRTGDFERHYLLEDAGEIMPYRVYVPASYSKADKHPLIVALHGLGGNEDSMVSATYGMKELAESRGYIIAAPMGFRPDGGYGGYGARPANRNSRLSEQDVMEVLQMMQEHYNIDSRRIYLMGHSMGGIGTWNMASRHPDIWAALGPIAGTANPAIADKIHHIPQIVVHGDNDTTVPVTGSQRMVEALRALNATVNYIEVPGGGHSDIAPANMSNIFDFFDQHKRPES
jgi:poly(3-hydroxybutyrate) depolymerase